MKLTNSNLLTKLVSIVGATGVALLMSLPSGANEVVNPVQVAQQSSGAGGRSLNPSPSIFNEPPYNRSRTAPGEATPPSSLPTTPPGTTPSYPPSSTTGGKDLVSLTQSNSQFKKLTQALKAAGLTATLKGKGPFTLFAPTDAAFNELPQDALAELFKPENKEVLVKILTYHVVPGEVLSSNLKSGEVKTVEGSPINVKVDPKNGVMVDDAKVIQPDIKASNGVIHVINKVILPPNL
jgi:uncharacterized surface protein with fasciclin (FAS1) repeats